MNDVYDVAVIGLGPAGATLARLLSKDLKVIVFHKKSGEPESPEISENKSFRKPCGGLLAPDAQKLLSRFGLSLPKSILVDPQIFSVRTIDIKSKLIRFYQRFYMNMDRERFDNWLISLIPKSVEISNKSIVKSIEKTGGNWKIYYTQNGESKQISSKYIIGADGANSIVRRAVFPNQKIRTYLSIQQWFKNEDSEPFYSSIFDSGITDCYAWGLSKDDYFIFGGAFKLKNARKSFGKLKQKIEPFGFDLTQPVRTEACMVLRPSNPFQFCTAKDNAFLIGEAAGFISPSSLEGISYAMQSAYLLSKVFTGKSRKNLERQYKKATRKIRIKLIFKMFKCPFLYSPFLRKIIMRSGLKSIKNIITA
ncbi:MAG: FAD-binding protein [Oscillospiraceae bacterium]|nr:FAD-binding protein [Oscillospiraceae bacterium]